MTNPKVKVPLIYLEPTSINDLAEARAGNTPSASDIERDVWAMEAALRLARGNRLRIVTSYLSVAECTGADISQPEISSRLKTFLGMLLLSGKSGVRLVQMTQTIATDARNIRWVEEIGGLKGADAVHVATARFMKCDEMWTRDIRHILKKRDALKTLGLTVLQPNETRLMEVQPELRFEHPGG